MSQPAARKANSHLRTSETGPSSGPSAPPRPAQAFDLDEIGRALGHDPAVAAAKDNLPWGCGWVFGLHRCSVKTCARVEPCISRFAEGVLPGA